MIFSCNTIPVSEDDTYAYFRRWTLIDFPNKFEGKSDNKNLINEITTNEEISGILNETLKGLKRLIDNQCFSNELATEEVRERIIRASDSVAAFIMDELNINPKGFIPKQELYEAYLSYCGKVRSPPVSDQKFFQRLLKRISLEDYKPNVGGKRVYCWRGIEFKNRENYIEDERM
jgi:putative DNA primase/helicase